MVKSLQIHISQGRFFKRAKDNIFLILDVMQPSKNPVFD